MDRTRSEPSTAPGSPEESEDEEEADIDYDDVSLNESRVLKADVQVLAIIDTRRPEASSPKNKRRGLRSYSDLSAGKLGTGSPRTDDVPLPHPDDEGTNRLTMRKNTGKKGAEADD